MYLFCRLTILQHAGNSSYPATPASPGPFVMSSDQLATLTGNSAKLQGTLLTPSVLQSLPNTPTSTVINSMYRPLSYSVNNMLFVGFKTLLGGNTI